jgi:ribonucleoside-diphosphate reductase alpha chain
LINKPKGSIEGCFMKVVRHFTAMSGDPYNGIAFVPRTSKITKANGEVVFEMKDIIVPDSWSQVAVDILAQKYFRRRGVGSESGGETDARQVFHRLAGCWREWGTNHGYFDSTDDADAYYDEMCNMLARQVGAPNSPQWFNTGLNFAYGIQGPAQGHFYVDPVTGETKRASNAYERPQPHACFIQSVNDDLVGEGGIMDLWTREARLFKYGSGTGSNFSRIRGTDEPLSGGGKSSGLMSFLAVGDKAAGAIKSGGTTRRAAKMIVLDIDHPDVEAFIGLKVKEERKVAMLVAGSALMRKHWDAMCESVESDPKRDADHRVNVQLGERVKSAADDGIPAGFILQCLGRLKDGDFDRDIQDLNTDWEGEAYATVTGMNANNSLRVSNAYMEAAMAGKDWDLTARVGGHVVKTLKADRLWRDIAKAAWACADPGLQFDTTINEWHTCPKGGRINGSNPCSEFMFLDDTACNLASLNLCTFMREDGSFDVASFRHAVRLWTITLEISVLMASYPSERIAELSHLYRPLGLGFANLGAMLMRMGIPYDSEAGRQWCAAISALMTGQSYATSAEMAAAVGPFPAFDANRGDMLRVIRNHWSAAHGGRGYDGLSVVPSALRGDHVQTDLVEAARQAWDDAYAGGEQFGFRNSQVTVLAPTGTIGLLMDCDTTGIEPDFALVKFKKLAGGGYFKIVNQSIPVALVKLGYSASEIEDIIAYVTGITKIDEATPGIKRSELLAAGFTNSEVDRIEREAPNAFDAAYEVPVDELETRGFAKEAIATFISALNGSMTIEGAPHIKDEHLPVFDCANRCGPGGRRFIHPEAHLGMMSMAQPFLSGAISKTVNVPSDTSVKEVANLHETAWRMGLKSIAIYRDASKMSQAISSNLGLLDGDDHRSKVEAVAKALARGVRRKLPTRRGGYTQAATIGGTKMYLRTGEYEDGAIGEIFLDIHREGAAFRSILNCFAIAVSIGLQYGVPLDEFCEAFIFTKFEPSGMVLGNDHVKFANSLIDYIFRELAITYMERYDLAQGDPEIVTRPTSLAPGNLTFDSISANAKRIPVVNRTTGGLAAETARVARERGFTGDICGGCGNSTMVRNGSCLKCNTCGATTGCS